jgi:hypothetical protein
MKKTVKMVALLLAACILVSCSAGQSVPNATADALRQTVVAIAAQSTRDALPSATPEVTQTPLVISATETGIPTVAAQKQEPSATPAPSATATETLVPSATPTVTITTTPDIYAKIKAANILVYELPDSNGNLVGRVDKALEGLKLSGGTVLNTHDRLGNFITSLHSQSWDLVIIAAESRSIIDLGSLGVLDDIMKHVENGGALIVEGWNFDEDQSNLASFILDECHARVEKNWVRLEDYDSADFFISDLGGSELLLNKPNQILMPLEPSVYWMGDVGDLIRLVPGSDARIVAGLVSQDPYNYGLITACNQGRLVLQTFSTHDYRLLDMVQLWENYITFTLRNHFNFNTPNY